MIRKMIFATDPNNNNSARFVTSFWAFLAFSFGNIYKKNAFPTACTNGKYRLSVWV